MNDIFFEEELYRWMDPVRSKSPVKKFSYEDKASITFMWINGEFYLNSIWVEEEHRSRGIASEIIRRLCDMADRHKIKIALEVVPMGDATRNDLLRFYQKNRFRIVRYGSIPGMTRKPLDKVCELV